ncbi:MAG TPA: isoprenylcysteine carboxylmethyltransferase family protein [Stellaceae bacterium]|nr:isoprenylcysteine carboxylmethyltransferase family protein [Stellaceae bacterium]
MIAKLVISTVGLIAVIGVFLFASAGTVDWPAAWGFLAEMAVLNLATGFWLAHHDPALLAERLGSPFQRAQKTWDKVFMAAVMVLYFAWIALNGLDARWKLSWMPLWLQVLGALGVALSMYIVFLTFRENTFAAPVVKIQRERGQTVIDTGPYAYVRHPMYVGGILMFLTMPLQLGSWLGIAGALLLVLPGLAFRIVMEERTLTAELEGYRNYAGRVRWRLIPGVW